MHFFAVIGYNKYFKYCFEFCLFPNDVDATIIWKIQFRELLITILLTLTLLVYLYFFLSFITIITCQQYQEKKRGARPTALLTPPPNGFHQCCIYISYGRRAKYIAFTVIRGRVKATAAADAHGPRSHVISDNVIMTKIISLMSPRPAVGTWHLCHFCCFLAASLYLLHVKVPRDTTT
jgi:hypothetical protein